MNIRQQIGKLTEKYIDELTENWLEIYEPDLALNNLNKLVDHVDTFYNEVLDETVARKRKILDRIKGNQSYRILTFHIILSFLFYPIHIKKKRITH